jgi:hypothetical protein
MTKTTPNCFTVSAKVGLHLYANQHSFALPSAGTQTAVVYLYCLNFTAILHHCALLCRKFFAFIVKTLPYADHTGDETGPG